VKDAAFGERACPRRECSEGQVRMRPGIYARTMDREDDENLKRNIGGTEFAADDQARWALSATAGVYCGGAVLAVATAASALKGNNLKKVTSGVRSEELAMVSLRKVPYPRLPSYTVISRRMFA